MGVLHIAQSGWFPFCIQTASGIWDGTGFPGPAQVGPGTFYPLGVPLATAMRWYWKVKAWHIASDLALSGTQPAAPYAFTLSLPADDDAPVAAAQGALVCPTPLSYSADPVLLTLWTESAQLFQLGTLYYPCLRLRLATTSLTVSTYKPDASFPKAWPAGSTFDGVPLSLWYDESSDYNGIGGAPGDSGPWTQAQAGGATVTAATLF